MAREVAIVGAGIVGLATAHHLLEEGWRVRLIERGGIAEGASLGNAGALAFTDVLPLASPGILRKAPRWMLDPLGPWRCRRPTCRGSRPGSCASGAPACPTGTPTRRRSSPA